MGNEPKTDDEIADAKEAGYIAGRRAAYRTLLMQCARELGKGDPLTEAAAMLSELSDTRVALRRVCEKFGDIDYTENLYLADVVEKHLERYLDEAAEDEIDDEGVAAGMAEDCHACMEISATGDEDAKGVRHTCERYKADEEED